MDTKRLVFVLVLSIVFVGLIFFSNIYRSKLVEQGPEDDKDHVVINNPNRSNYTSKTNKMRNVNKKHIEEEKQRKRLRIAVMFVGAPRTLSQLGVMTSHVVNVIDSVGAGGRDIVDVFLHLNVNTSDSSVNSRNVRGYVRPFTDSHLRLLKELMSPVQVILHQDSGCSGINGTIANHSCCHVRANPINFAGFLQFAYTRASYRYVKEYEKQQGIKYDWYIRLRPDIGCFEPIPAARSLSPIRFYLMTKERPQGYNLNDYIFIVPQQLSFSFYEEQIMNIFDRSCGMGQEPIWPPEASLFYSEPHVPFQVLPLACVHVMGPYEAECFRLHRREQPTASTIFEIDGSRYNKQFSFEEGCFNITREGYFAERNHTFLLT